MLVRAGVGLVELVAREEGGLLGRQRLALGRPVRPRAVAGPVALGRERHEVEAAGLAERACGSVRVRDAGSSTTIRSVPWVWTTGSATPVRVDAVLDDRLDRRQSRLHRAPCRPRASPGTRPAGRRRRSRPSFVSTVRGPPLAPTRAASRLGPEVDDEGEHAEDDEDEDRGDSTHRPGMLHALAPWRRWPDPGRVPSPATPGAALMRAARPGRSPGPPRSAPPAPRGRAWPSRTSAGARARARRSDARQVVEGRLHGRLAPQVAVVRDREAVRLVAEALDQVQRRRGRRAAPPARRGRAGTAPRAPWPARRSGSRRRPSSRRTATSAASWPFPPSTMIRSGSAQRSSSALPSSPAFAAVQPAAEHLRWLAKSSWPADGPDPEAAIGARPRLARPRRRPCCRRSRCPGTSRCRSTRSAAAGRQPEGRGKLLERHQRLALVGKPARLLAGERSRRRSARQARPGVASRPAREPGSRPGGRAGLPGTPPGRRRRPAAWAAGWRAGRTWSGCSTGG